MAAERLGCSDGSACVNKLPASQELDAAVARVLFGRATLQSPRSNIWGYADGIEPDTISTERLPTYSADTTEGWAAMRSIVARLRELGMATLLLSLESDGTWEVELLAKPYAPGLRSIIHGGATLPEALCRGALAAVEGQEVDGE